MPPGPQPRLASVMDAVVGTPIPTSHTKDMFSQLLTTPAMDSILSSVSPKAVLTAGCCLQTTVPCRGGVSPRKAWGFVTVQDNSIIHLSSKTSTGNTATVLPESAHLFHPPFQSPMAVSQGPYDTVLQSGLRSISPSRQIDQHRGNKSREGEI